MHRDIKCANVLIASNGACKLADFNVSKVVNSKDGLLQTQTGTPYYASPEVWKDRPYDFKSDIWSLGCVLYEMAALRPPFKAHDMNGLYKKVVSGNYPPLSSRYSIEFREIIHMMLQPDPSLRPTCHQLLSLPAMVEKVNQFGQFDQNIATARERFLTVPGQKDTGTESQLIKTIQLPRVLR